MNRYLFLQQFKRQLLITLCLLASISGVSASELKSISLVDDWGVELIYLRVTAAGYMIEFRYKILDDQKALILSSRKDFPYLLAMKSKAKLSVPYGSTVGFLKSNRPFLKKGKNYVAMFSNEGQHLLPGDKVKIQVKNEISEELTVQ